MMVRLLLASWMFLTSALGPALCCCVPIVRFSFSASEIQKSGAPLLKVCPHCQGAAPARPESDPAGQCPCDPTSPGQKDCPCRNHHLTPAVADDAGVRPAVEAVWSFALHPPAVLPAEPPPLDAVAVRTDHTGPPPLAGIDLLHRLHILVC